MVDLHSVRLYAAWSSFQSSYIYKVSLDLHLAKGASAALIVRPNVKSDDCGNFQIDLGVWMFVL